MKTKHYVLIGTAVVFALLPAIAPSLLPVAIIGAFVGLLSVFWTLRDIDNESLRLKDDIKKAEEEVAKAHKERDDAIAHAGELDKFFNDNGYAELAEIRQKIEVENADFDKQIEAKRIEFEQEMERQCAEYERELSERNAQQEQILQEKTLLEMRLQKEIENLTARREGAMEFVQKYDEAQKKYNALISKFARAKKNFDAVEYCLGNWMHLDDKPIAVLNAEVALDDQNSLEPIGEIDIKAFSIPDLRKEAKQISRRIDAICEEFSTRYQTKALKSLYAVTVIYLKIELRVILEELRYKAQEEAISKVGKLMLRVRQLYEDGNRTILPTVVAFLGELEKIFIDAVKVEYLWYLRKEQQRQEQIP